MGARVQHALLILPASAPLQCSQLPFFFCGGRFFHKLNSKFISAILLRVSFQN
jgi:hypothetical protein